MKILDLVSIIASFLFALLTFFYPDFPLGQEAFIALIVWLAGRLGVVAVKREQAERGK